MTCALTQTQRRGRARPIQPLQGAKIHSPKFYNNLGSVSGFEVGVGLCGRRGCHETGSLQSAREHTLHFLDYAVGVPESGKLRVSYLEAFSGEPRCNLGSPHRG